MTSIKFVLKNQSKGDLAKQSFQIGTEPVKYGNQIATLSSGNDLVRKPLKCLNILIKQEPDGGPHETVEISLHRRDRILLA